MSAEAIAAATAGLFDAKRVIEETIRTVQSDVRNVAMDLGGIRNPAAA